MSGHDEFAMDLIGNDAHVVLVADVSHTLQFVAGPNTAGGVMGVTEQEDGGLIVSALSFEG